MIDKLASIETIFFLSRGGINDNMVAITRLLILVELFCPNCEDISCLIPIGCHMHQPPPDIPEIFYENYIDLPKIDIRMRYERNEEIEIFINNNNFYIDETNRSLYLYKYDGINEAIAAINDTNIKELFYPDSYGQKIKNNYFSQITVELQQFIEKNNIKGCVGIHLRLDNHWPDPVIRVIDFELIKKMFLGLDRHWPPQIVNHQVIWDFYSKKEGGQTILDPNEFKNSQLRLYERFIFEKEREGVGIFFASDCPVAANYFSRKYSNVIQYKDYIIDKEYIRWFYDGDISSPYNRDHNDLSYNGQVDFDKGILGIDKRCLYDYICLGKCKSIVSGAGGIHHNYLLDSIKLSIEDEVMENYQNIGI